MLMIYEGSEGSKQTISLRGKIHCQEVLMLVDLGSFCSYVGSHLMPLFPHLEKLPNPVQVQADEGELNCQYQIPQRSWLCQG